MAKIALCLLFVLSFLYMSGKAESATATDPAATNFIKASCRATRYPALCLQCLLSYADQIQQSHEQLAQVALTVSLARARSAVVFVSNMTQLSGIKPREYQAVKDCVNNLGATVDQLSKSIHELGQMSRATGQDFTWHTSNVQTSVSAALTYANTCVDGFTGPTMDGNVKVRIKSRVTDVAEVTSNALALVNRFAARHRASAP
ncbi:Pectinesterase inhibitor domain protein [Actinidia chinensis var. chinensis]|uniref:Pectinesterase inhibitor domain protein n=1 Tax=Actinidia chinensis var. chinensis TaxID=1590841 RepID=A0A2R6PI63_ACTCC|nr:Pectinesterase inhibitor domain protein [Actinidia chinensis var. chinensis]